VQSGYTGRVQFATGFNGVRSSKLARKFLTHAILTNLSHVLPSLLPDKAGAKIDNLLIKVIGSSVIILLHVRCIKLLLICV